MEINLILTNGKIYTLDGRQYEAIAVSGNQIAMLGTTKEVEAAGERAEIKIDLKGKCVLPGFNDSHLHLVEFGLSAEMLNLEAASSIDEIINDGKNYICNKEKQKGDWVLGYGWNEKNFRIPAMPSKEDLDKISTEHPIMITRVCEHIAVVNTKALEVTGADRDTKIKGGSFDKDQNGELTGVIRENTLDWFTDRLPKREVEEIKTAILTAASQVVQFGLTSLQTSDLHSCTFDVMYDAYTQLKEEGRLPVRIYEQLYLPEMDILTQFLERGFDPGQGDDFFRLGPMKLLTDGCLGARTAALREDYSDESGNRGMFTYEQEELDALVLKAHQSGMQVFLHAIGDGAIEACLKSMERALEKYPRAHRHVINHFQIAGTDLFEKASKLGVIADIQPAFICSDWDIAEDKVGPERLKASYAWKSMLESGMRLMGSSDCPVEHCNPFNAIYAAVTRKDLEGKLDKAFMPEQVLTVKQAINLLTINSAYGSFDEKKKGVLAEGYLADMVVVSEDPFTVEKDKLKDIKVLMTIMDGKIRYDSAQ